MKFCEGFQGVGFRDLGPCVLGLVLSFALFLLSGSVYKVSSQNCGPCRGTLNIPGRLVIVTPKGPTNFEKWPNASLGLGLRTWDAFVLFPLLGFQRITCPNVFWV